MKIAGRYFNPSCVKIFQKSLTALYHSPLQLYIYLPLVFWRNVSSYLDLLDYLRIENPRLVVA